MKIVNDTLHNFSVKFASKITIRQRYVAEGNWNGGKTIGLSFDCDFIEDMNAISNLLKVLDSYSIRCSFALIGSLIKDHQDTVKSLLSRGHEIINHTDTHPNQFLRLNSNRKREEITRFQAYMTKFGVTPSGFRVPHGARYIQKDLYQLLHREGFQYDSSLIGTGLMLIDGMIELPITPCPEHPLTSFDSYHHFRLPIFSATEGKVSRLWKELLRKYIMVNVFLDPIDFISNSRIKLLEDMISLAIHENFCFLTLHEIASKHR
jgi:peptidoglycan/xylan/chitin deacetylase (PgdA/CDA1 family)